MEYIVNKLLFRSVRSNRKSSLTHKYLYDRHLSDFAKVYSDKILEGRINNILRKRNGRRFTISINRWKDKTI